MSEFETPDNINNNDVNNDELQKPDDVINEENSLTDEPEEAVVPEVTEDEIPAEFLSEDADDDAYEDEIAYDNQNDDSAIFDESDEEYSEEYDTEYDDAYDESYDESYDEEADGEYAGDDIDEEYADEDTDEDETETFDQNVSHTLKHIFSKKVREFRLLNSAKKRKILTVTAVVILLFVLVITDLIPILPNSYHRSYVGNRCTLGKTMGSDAKAYGDGVLYASNGSLICYGPDLKEKFKLNTFDGIPTIRTNKGSAAVFCRGGGDVFVMTGKNNYRTVSVDETVLSVSLNENGDYIIVTSEMGYTACVSAYSAMHKSLYKWHTNSDITDTAISPSSKRLVASCVEYSESDIYGKLVFLDTAQPSPINEVVIDDNIISELYFPDENTVIAIGSAYTVAYTANGNQKWKIEYDGKLLKTFDISDEGNIAFLFNRYNSELSESEVILYNTSGKRTGKYESKSNIRSISVNNGYCLLVLDKETVLIDSDGDAKKSKKRELDYQYNVLYNNYNFAFCVNDNIAEILSVKH